MLEKGWAQEGYGTIFEVKKRFVIFTYNKL